MGAPNILRYLPDVVIAVIVCLMLRKERLARLKSYPLTIGLMALWWGFMIVSTLVREHRLLWMLWASRNWCRGFVFFAACLIFLDRTDHQRIFELLKGLFILNFAVVLIQYFVFDCTDDHLGGIFGTRIGCNGQSNIFLCVVTILVLYEALDSQRCSFWTGFCIIADFIVAGLEELKVFFYEYLLLLLGLMVLLALKKRLHRPTLMKMLLVSVVGYVIGLYCTWLVMPETFRVLVGLKSYAQYEKESSVEYKISRIHAFEIINELFFKGDSKLLFAGYGFGNCDYSAFPPLTSDFYWSYGDYNYLWFVHQDLFLEGGIMGLALYVLIFVQMGVQGMIVWCRSEKGSRETALFLLFIGVTLISIIYNNTLRTEISYFTYFVLAAGFATTVENTHK